MSKINFPVGWHRNIGSFEYLSNILKTEEKEMKEFIRYIPGEYRLKRINERVLRIPSRRLKNYQKIILRNILNQKLPTYVHGGVLKQSIITNAKTHQESKWVMKLDIEKFFPSINFKRIENVFLSLGCSRDSARALTQLTTLDKQLPQGAPTSPKLSNLVLYSFDKRILNLCQKWNLKYSRFFDDITISGSKPPSKIYNTCKKITKAEGFWLKNDKYEEKSTEEGCVITGVYLKKGTLSMPPDLKREFFLDLNNATRGVFNENSLKLEEKIRGQLAFLRSINQKEWDKANNIFQKIEWR